MTEARPPLAATGHDGANLLVVYDPQRRNSRRENLLTVPSEPKQIRAIQQPRLDGEDVPCASARGFKNEWPYVSPDQNNVLWRDADKINQDR